MTEQRHHVGGIDAGQLALMKDVADASAEAVAKKLFLAIGIDTSNPIEAQDTFAALRKIARKLDDPEAIADGAWTRRRRMWSEGVVGYAVKAIVSAIAVGGLGAFASGLAGVLGVSIPHK